jgi:hypothetical protein
MGLPQRIAACTHESSGGLARQDTIGGAADRSGRCFVFCGPGRSVFMGSRRGAKAWITVIWHSHALARPFGFPLAPVHYGIHPRAGGCGKVFRFFMPNPQQMNRSTFGGQRAILG